MTYAKSKPLEAMATYYVILMTHVPLQQRQLKRRLPEVRRGRSFVLAFNQNPTTSARVPTALPHESYRH